MKAVHFIFFCFLFKNFSCLTNVQKCLTIRATTTTIGTVDDDDADVDDDSQNAAVENYLLLNTMHGKG